MAVLSNSQFRLEAVDAGTAKAKITYKGTDGVERIVEITGANLSDLDELNAQVADTVAGIEAQITANAGGVHADVTAAVGDNFAVSGEAVTPA